MIAKKLESQYKNIPSSVLCVWVKVSIILPGVDDEILDLARSLKVNIDAVADPNFRGNWDNYKIFESRRQFIRICDTNWCDYCDRLPSN